LLNTKKDNTGFYSILELIDLIIEIVENMILKKVLFYKNGFGVKKIVVFLRNIGFMHKKRPNCIVRSFQKYIFTVLPVYRTVPW
jgi:hypothetical protein